MGLPLKKESEKFTYADYLTWPDDERWEIIEGIPYNMAPAPSRKNQRILGKLFNQIENYLEDKDCEVYLASFDVRLTEKYETDEETTSVVQPDIVIICDKDKLDDKGCKGAPDLVIEILSPSTAAKDIGEKFNLYERHKVKEYWIVYPNDEIVMVYKLDGKEKYKEAEVFVKDEKIKVGIFEDLIIDLSAVFIE